LGLALVAGTGREVGATTIIQVNYGPVSDLFIIAGGSGSLSAGDIAGLNADLAAVGANYVFTQLGATSTSPDGNPGILTQTGEVDSIGAHALGDTIQIVASSDGYISPVPTTTMFSSGGSVFSNTQAGNNSNFQSWFNPSGALYPAAGSQQEPSPTVTALSPGGVGPFTRGGDAPPTGVTPATSYSLTNVTNVTVTGGTATAPAKDQFAGSTTVVASGVPEPATMTMTLIALPMFFTLPFFRNRRAKA